MGACTSSPDKREEREERKAPKTKKSARKYQQQQQRYDAIVAKNPVPNTDGVHSAGCHDTGNDNGNGIGTDSGAANHNQNQNGAGVLGNNHAANSCNNNKMTTVGGASDVNSHPVPEDHLATTTISGATYDAVVADNLTGHGESGDGVGVSTTSPTSASPSSNSNSNSNVAATRGQSQSLSQSASNQTQSSASNDTDGTDASCPSAHGGDRQGQRQSQSTVSDIFSGGGGGGERTLLFSAPSVPLLMEGAADLLNANVDLSDQELIDDEDVDTGDVVNGGDVQINAKTPAAAAVVADVSEIGEEVRSKTNEDDVKTVVDEVKRLAGNVDVKEEVEEAVVAVEQVVVETVPVFKKKEMEAEVEVEVTSKVKEVVQETVVKMDICSDEDVDERAEKVEITTPAGSESAKAAAVSSCPLLDAGMDCNFPPEVSCS